MVVPSLVRLRKELKGGTFGAGAGFGAEANLLVDAVCVTEAATWAATDLCGAELLVWLAVAPSGAACSRVKGSAIWSHIVSPITSAASKSAASSGQRLWWRAQTGHCGPPSWSRALQ